MKGLKWKSFVKFGVLFTSLFATFVITSADTNAYSFDYVYNTPVYGGTIYGDKGGNSFTRESYVLNGSSYQITVNDTTGVQTYSKVSRISFDIGPNNWYIPANSIFNFTVRYYTNSPDDGVSITSEYLSANAIILDKSCINQHSAVINTGDTYNADLYCTYWAYTDSDIRLGFDLWVDAYFPYPRYSGQIWIPQVINYAVITSDGSGGTFNGLTEAQLNGDFKTWLQSQLTLIYNNGGSQLTALNQIKALIQSQGATESQIKESIDDLVDLQEAQQAQDEQDRENITGQQTDLSSDSSDSQSDAQSTGTTLLAAFTAFVNALTNANPSNCNIDMDMGNLDLGVVNFCQLSPPPGFTTLSSIFLILFCVPLSIATGRKVISLFRSFQT